MSPLRHSRLRATLAKAIKHALPHTTSNPSQLHVEVKHRFPGPNRYSWELRRAQGLPVQESTIQYRSWEEASQAGTLAFKLLLQDPLELKKLGLS